MGTIVAQDALFTLVQLDPVSARQLLATVVHDGGRVVPVHHRERRAIRRAHSRVFLVGHDIEWHPALRVHHLRVQDRLLRAAELETDRVPRLGTTGRSQRRRAAPSLLWRRSAVLAIVGLGRAVMALWVWRGPIALLRLERIVWALRGGAIAWRSCVRRGGLISSLLLSVGLLVPDLLGLTRGLLLIPALALRGGILR